jgi:hypothetical protein
MRTAGSVRLTTMTISGAWVNTREMTPVNFSRCAGSIASFSAAKMEASRSLACFRAAHPDASYIRRTELPKGTGASRSIE